MKYIETVELLEAKIKYLKELLDATPTQRQYQVLLRLKEAQEMLDAFNGNIK